MSGQFHAGVRVENTGTDFFGTVAKGPHTDGLVPVNWDNGSVSFCEPEYLTFEKGTIVTINMNKEMLDWLLECEGCGMPELAHKALHGKKVIVGEFFPNCKTAYFPAHYEVHDVDTGEMLDIFFVPSALCHKLPEPAPAIDWSDY